MSVLLGAVHRKGERGVEAVVDGEAGIESELESVVNVGRHIDEMNHVRSEAGQRRFG